MRKKLSIIVILMFVLSLCGTVLAAPAGDDVPKDHWAYPAVKELVRLGIVDGYEDGKFMGDKTMTRYEMAQIVEKALNSQAKVSPVQKALIDKLAMEFALEMNKISTRVAKVENKTKVWFGGDTRMRYVTDNPGPSNVKALDGADRFEFRQRFKVWGDINENASFTGRMVTAGGNKFGYTDAGPGSTVYVDIANITYKNFAGIDSIRAGRSALDFFGNGLIGKPMDVDGVLIKEKMGKFQFTGWTGNIKTFKNGSTADAWNSQQLSTAELGYQINKKLGIKAGYYYADIPGTSTAAGLGTLNTNVGAFDSSKGWSAAANYKIGGYTLLADFISSSLNGASGLPNHPKGWSVQLSNTKQTTTYFSAALLVNPAKVGSDAWMVSYRSVDAGAIPNGAGGFDTTAVAYNNQSYNIFTHGTDNVNVWYLAYQKVLAKNTVMSLEYQNFKIKDRGLTNLTSDGLNKTFMTKFEFFY